MCISILLIGDIKNGSEHQNLAVSMTNL